MSFLGQSLKAFAGLVTLVTFTGVAVFSGCEQSQPPAATAADTGPTGGGPLGDVLVLSAAGDTEAAIQSFVDEAPANWIESSSLEELQLSEADFNTLSRSEKSRIQARIIARVGDIKGLARTVVDKASALKKEGNSETAEKYIESVNQLGRQLCDADIVLVFQQTGKALANASLED